jgi:N4-gp56 family major capsid protein
MATGKHFDDEYIIQMEQGVHATPLPKFIFWQFTSERRDFTKRRGETIRVMAPRWLTPQSDPFADAKLSSLASKVADQATQLWDMTKQEITIDEYLLKNPLALQDYDVRHSEHNLRDINTSMLSENYHHNTDDRIRKRLTDNTFRSYAGGNAAAAAMDTNDVMKIDEFIDVSTTLHKRNIPTYPDGTYIAVIDPSTRGTLMKEQKFLDATVRGLQARAPVFTGELVVYGDIRFVVSNNIPQVTVGQSGTPFAASQAIVFGTGTLDMFPLGTADGLVPNERFNFLMGQGAGPVVKVVGMDVEVRPHEITDFGRFREVIWIEECEIKLLDADPSQDGAYAGKSVGTDSRFVQLLYGYNAV